MLSRKTATCPGGLAGARRAGGLGLLGLCAILQLFFAFFAGAALADSRVDFLASRLAYPPLSGRPDDFRVRTNAALALGATNDDAAVLPLCGGLSDPSDAVRQATAVALRRLARSSSVDCLKRRLAVESSDPVKAEIRKAIDAIAGAGGGGKPAHVANAKYYVSISPVTNRSGRPTADIDAVVRAAMVQKLADLGGYEVAPVGETVAQAKGVVAARTLKGYYLSVGVEAFDYSGGNLRVKVKIAVFSYPEKDLRGEIPASASMPGATPGDKANEDQLMTAVAARATELFSQNFQ